MCNCRRYTCMYLTYRVSLTHSQVSIHGSMSLHVSFQNILPPPLPHMLSPRSVDVAHIMSCVPVAECCSILHCVAESCSVLHCVALCCTVLHCVEVCCTVLQCVTVCCSILHCVAVYCTVLQCAVAVSVEVKRFTSFVCLIYMSLYIFILHLWSHCDDTLQHTATHCNTLQHTKTHCNTLQYTATHCNTRTRCVGCYERRMAPNTATRCNTL